MFEQLADGHAAWLVTGPAEVRSALNDRRLSKNMHAAFAADGGRIVSTRGRISPLATEAIELGGAG